jgi:hypothetical protein
MNEANGKQHRSGPRIQGGSAGARQWAAAILQVLGGEWTPGQGAQALGTSLPHYYAVESRAMGGLVTACEPRKGRRNRQSEKEIADLKKHIVRLERECARKQALLRASQRTAGIQAPLKKAGSKRTRRPMARALKMAAALHKADGAEPQEEGVLS